RLRTRCTRQRPSQSHVRPLQSPQDRGPLQSLRPGPSLRLCPRPAPLGNAPEHEGVAVIRSAGASPAKFAIVDYQAGNLASVQKALTHLGCESCVTSDPYEVRRADRIILPGVGHFATMQRLADSGLRDAVRESINRGTPFFGICLGMQWLFAGSTEAPQVEGLKLFEGMCEHFPAGVKSPHVGWNDVQTNGPSRLFAGVPHDAFVYFTHSYRAPVADGVV